MVQGTKDEMWAGLVDEEDAVREPKMQARFEELVTLSEDARRAQLQAIAACEYSQAAEKLVPLTKSRLKALLSLGTEDARTIAASYDAVMQTMPADIAMRRVTIVQSLATEFTPEEEAKLVELLPNIFAGAPGRRNMDILAKSGSFERREEPASSRKPSWAFWRK